MYKIGQKTLFSQEEQLKITQFLKEKKSLKKIGLIFNCSHKSIATEVKRLGLKADAGRFEMSEDQVRYAKEKYAEGKGLQSIAKELHIWVPNLKKVLESNGIEIKKRKHNSDLGEKIRPLFEDTNIPVKHICRDLGITVKVLQRFVKELNLVRKYKISFKKKNPRGFLEIWIDKYGYEAGSQKYLEYIKEASIKSSGENNPMYGKPTLQGAGNGWKGWYKDIYFRSLRELCFMIRMDKEGKQWESGESIKIEYEFNNKKRNYRPDFVVNNDIYEIKPEKLINTPQVQAKKIAAEIYCLDKGLNYIIIDEKISVGNIFWALLKNNLVFSQDYKKRFTHQVLFKFGPNKISYKDWIELLKPNCSYDKDMSDDEIMDWGI